MYLEAVSDTVAPEYNGRLRGTAPPLRRRVAVAAAAAAKDPAQAGSDGRASHFRPVVAGRGPMRSRGQK